MTKNVYKSTYSAAAAQMTRNLKKNIENWNRNDFNNINNNKNLLNFNANWNVTAQIFRFISFFLPYLWDHQAPFDVWSAHMNIVSMYWHHKSRRANSRKLNRNTQRIPQKIRYFEEREREKPILKCNHEKRFASSAISARKISTVHPHIIVKLSTMAEIHNFIIYLLSRADHANNNDSNWNEWKMELRNTHTRATPKYTNCNVCTKWTNSLWSTIDLVVEQAKRENRTVASENDANGSPKWSSPLYVLCDMTANVWAYNLNAHVDRTLCLIICGVKMGRQTERKGDRAICRQIIVNICTCLLATRNVWNVWIACSMYFWVYSNARNTSPNISLEWMESSTIVGFCIHHRFIEWSRYNVNK